MHIFVSICSYRDPLLPHTIKSMMQTKSNRHDVTYAIFEQTRYEDSLEHNEPVIVSRDDVIYKRIDPEYSDGCVWARYINLLNATEEHDFIYQIDSHILHDPNWDRSLVEDYKRAMEMEGTNKIVLTGSCKEFAISVEEDGEIRTLIPEYPKAFTTSVKYCGFNPETLIPVAHGEKIEATEMPTKGFHILAGNFFTHYDWIQNVGLDPKIYFVGEEVMMSMMSFAAGYSIYHHSETVSYHYEDTVDWHSKPNINPIGNHKRREYLSARGKMQWRKYLDNCREDILVEFHKQFGVDFINLVIEERARTYELDKTLTENDVIKRPVEIDRSLPPPLFGDE